MVSTWRIVIVLVLVIIAITDTSWFAVLVIVVGVPTEGIPAVPIASCRPSIVAIISKGGPVVVVTASRRLGIFVTMIRHIRPTSVLNVVAARDSGSRLRG